MSPLTTEIASDNAHTARIPRWVLRGLLWVLMLLSLGACLGMVLFVIMMTWVSYTLRVAAKNRTVLEKIEKKVDDR